jgi:hypothetical protein
MKYLLLLLISTSAFALDFWEPHEKELATLEWKAAHSPQEKLAKKFSNIEAMDFVREFDVCIVGGVTKIENLQTPALEQPCVMKL